MDVGLFIVADGMGGQEHGEQASGMAVEIIPQVVAGCLALQVTPQQALIEAMHEANQEIMEAGKDQPPSRRMGTTAVCPCAWANRFS